MRASFKMDPPLERPTFLVHQPTPHTAGIFDFDPRTSRARGCEDFEGLIVVPGFLDLDESSALLAKIEEAPFAPAQSGKEKQHYGAKVNFNKRRINANRFTGLPKYLRRLESHARSAFLEFEGLTEIGREQRDRALASFETTDLFVLRYHESEASNLDLHVDDTFAYGEAIIDISLETDAVMTFVRHAAGATMGPECVRVPLEAGSAALLYGKARYEWEHGILHYDVRDRRTSLTLRTLSESLRATPDGAMVLDIARRKRI
jgi:alkylated DNA repair protein alkB family protein 4